MMNMQSLWQTFFQQTNGSPPPSSSQGNNHHNSLDPILPIPKRQKVAEDNDDDKNNNDNGMAQYFLMQQQHAAAQQAQRQQPQPHQQQPQQQIPPVPPRPVATPTTGIPFHNQSTATHLAPAPLAPAPPASSSSAALPPLAPQPPQSSSSSPAAVAAPNHPDAAAAAKPPPSSFRTEHRKRKNAEYARVTRERKRNQELLLNLELANLERENERLKGVVHAHMTAEDAQAVIGECCYKGHGERMVTTSGATSAAPHNADDGDATLPTSSSLPPASSSSSSGKLLRSDFDLIESLTKTRQSFVLTDPRLADNPIVYASRPFLTLTGYAREQVLGRNCRILQGPDTDPAAVTEIRRAIVAGKDGAACLLNYKADGTPFWNQFFVAPLRDKTNNVMNYVGVQHKIDKPEEPIPKKRPPAEVDQPQETPIFTPPVADKKDHEPLPGQSDKHGVDNPISNNNLDMMLQRADSAIMMKDDDDVDILDWAELAGALEMDYQEFDSFHGDINLDTTNTAKAAAAPTAAGVETGSSGQENDSHSLSTGGESLSHVPLTYLEQFFTSPPREFVARTIRSDLIDILMNNHGDVTDKRFLAGVDVLSELFKSSINFNTSLSTVLNGTWRSISRPMYHYGGCVGMNDRGDFVYTLGKMCFNMFKPGSVRVTLQHTMNHIEAVCRMDQLPTAAPWSLRRELALQDPGTGSNTMLKSYDVVVALTIEPGAFAAGKNDVVPSPSRRLKALQVARGYFLPDPDTPNRLTVWFTGGYLAPAPVTAEDLANGYGGLDDWVEFFGAEYKRTWSEALSDMGAKLFLGAELPNEMDPSGKMEYTLHRPFGGHGKGHADVMYVDGDFLITKGHSGSIHVMVKESNKDDSNDKKNTGPVQSRG